MPKDSEAGNVNTIPSTKKYIILAVGSGGVGLLRPHTLEAYRRMQWKLKASCLRRGSKKESEDGEAVMERQGDGGWKRGGWERSGTSCFGIQAHQHIYVYNIY